MARCMRRTGYRICYYPESLKHDTTKRSEPTPTSPSRYAGPSLSAPGGGGGWVGWGDACFSESGY
jgi:hypothetical protein